MRVDQHREHAERAVVLDESHAAHVGREIVDNGGATQSSFASLLLLQVQLQIFHTGKTLIPVIERFDIYCTDFLVSLPQEVGNKVTPNEAARSTHHRQVV